MTTVQMIVTRVTNRERTKIKMKQKKSMMTRTKKNLSREMKFHKK